MVSLRELLGVIGAHEWRKKGVEIPALGARIHPHYGVFSPVRGEYVDLVAPGAAARQRTLAFDIGTGTGVLAAVLARRGVASVVATDRTRARWPARARTSRAWALTEQVEVLRGRPVPARAAPLIVCNPPWLPARPSSPIEHAVYDPDSRMLRGFLAGLAAHLAPGGEGWLMLSDLAEHLGLRSRERTAGLDRGRRPTVLGRSTCARSTPRPPTPATRCTRRARRKSPRCGGSRPRHQNHEYAEINSILRS